MDILSYAIGKKAGGGGSRPTGTTQITTNGVHNVTSYATAEVDVPNSYAAADEGKVVSSGALVAQTARTNAITENGTYDTTTNDSVSVDVAGSSAKIYTGDEDYLMSTAGATICTLSSRVYTKTTADPAYASYYYRENSYTGPLLVSKVSDGVKYTAFNSTFSSGGSITYGGETWYYSSTNYAMPGNLTSSGGFARKLSDDSFSSAADAALELLETVKGVTFTENGLYEVPSGYDGYGAISVNVPNTYSASDEGKVVSNGILVAQTARASEITQNGTYDTTTNDEVSVNVEGGQTIPTNDFLFHFSDSLENSGKRSSVWRNVTGLELSNEQSKFGGRSLKCGTTQTRGNVYLEYDFGFGADDFTIDFWMYSTSLAASGTTKQVPLSFDYRSLALYVNQNSLNLGVAKSSSSWKIDQTASVSIVLNQWHHIAIVRSGETIYVFLNGTKVLEAVFGADALAPVSAITVGSNTNDSGDRRFNGYLDELRIKLGEAVWTSDFTPPTEAYM